MWLAEGFPFSSTRPFLGQDTKHCVFPSHSLLAESLKKENGKCVYLPEGQAQQLMCSFLGHGIVVLCGGVFGTQARVRERDLEGSLRSGGWSWRARSTEQPFGWSVIPVRNRRHLFGGSSLLP